MIMDEMELVGRMKDTEPLRPEAFEEARAVLRAAMASSGLVEPEPVQVPGPAPARARRRRRTLLTRGRAGAGLGIGAAAAAAVAVALVATSTPQQAANSGRPQAGSGTASARESAKAKPTAGSPSPSPVVNSQLMADVNVIKAKASDSPLPGDASLVITAQTNGSGPPDNIGYNLYTDSGDYYWAMTESGLPQAIADHENLANGVDGREVAAGLYAVNGDLATARVKMINASPNPFGLGDTPAQKKALEKHLHTVNAALKARGFKVPANPKPDTGKALQEDYDNYIWNNCMDALTMGGGNPQIRIGVLRLLSTVPEVTVRNSTTDGQATLMLTASNALFGGTGGDQVLTINASTGIPVSSVSGVPGQPPSSVVTYQVSRVTVADIEDGKF